MKKQVGLWIDHRQAVIVTLVDRKEEVTRLDSSLENRVHEFESGHAHGKDTRDKRDRFIENLLNKYYDEIITHLRDADSILILGPGEAKSELQKRMAINGLGKHIAAVKTSDKLTDVQIAAEIRQHFREKQHRSNR